MKKYDSYKDSGIKWIGEIPSHWDVKKLKFIGDTIGGLTYSPSDIVEDESNGVLVLRSSNIQNGKLSLEDNVFVNLEISEKQTLKKGDILICSRNGSQHLIGKNICIDERTAGNTFGAFMLIFRSNNFSFLNHFFNSPVFTSQSGLFLTATINQLTSSTLNNFYLAFPNSIDEQIIIANYLDQKTRQIDNLIAKKKQFIQLLEEKRIALINNAVTKGLDTKVPMKDSGIEWLGEIPEHWELWKISHAFNRIGSGTTPESGNPLYHENGTINWLNTGDLNDGEVSKCTKKVTKKATEDYTSLKLFPSGSLVMAMYGATIGKTGIIKFATTTNQACCVFCKGGIIDLKFLQYWFFAKKENIINLAIGGGQPNISQFILKDVKVNCPSMAEQKEIVHFLENKTNEITFITSKIQREIELLKEYKTSLISEVVTGKVDVSNEKLN